MDAVSKVRHFTSRVEGQAKRNGVAGGSPDRRRVLKALKVVGFRSPTPKSSTSSMLATNSASASGGMTQY
jgi:hypothetical protein